MTASDQMARLAALKEEEEEARLARLNREARFESRESKTAREAPRTSHAPEASRNVIGSEKEALRHERERLMRAQSARAAKRDAAAAAKEQTKSVKSVSSSDDGRKTSEDEAFEARVRAAKGETFEEMNDSYGGSYGENRTTATDAPDPRPPIGGWDEKPSAAAPPASARAESPSSSDAEFEIPKMPEKSFDEMSFEERVATAMAQSRNSGVADRVQKALIREEEEEKEEKEEEC